MSAQSLLIIDSDRSALLECLDPEGVRVVGSVLELRDGLRVIEAETPSIVILEARELEKGMKEVAHLLSNYPHLSVFVTAKEKNPDWILRLMRAGASEYLTKPVVREELAEAIRKVARCRPIKSVPIRKGAVISIYNPVAGMGTTTVAVNIAAALAAKGKRVVLADLNLVSGDVPAFLDLTPRYTLSSAAATNRQIDASFVNGILVPHSSGLRVLCGPTDLREAAALEPALVTTVISVLRTGFDFVVVDTGGPLFGCNTEIFSVSESVFFCTVLSLPALHNARRYLSAMDQEGVGDDRVKVLITRYLPKDEIKLSDAAKVLDRKGLLTVPNDFSAVRASINRGIPLVVSTPNSPVAKAIEEVASRLGQQKIQPTLKEVI